MQDTVTSSQCGNALVFQRQVIEFDGQRVSHYYTTYDWLLIYNVEADADNKYKNFLS